MVKKKTLRNYRKVRLMQSCFPRLELTMLALVCCLVGGCEHQIRSDARGLVLEKAGAAEGYVLFAPILATTTYLIDTRGLVVHTWDSSEVNAVSYLLDDGHILRSIQAPNQTAFTGAEGARIQELDWHGKVLWDFALPDEVLQHHDLEPLPNGNVLLIAYQMKTRAEALAVGRHPRRVGYGGLWPDCVVEIRPLPPDDGELVWRWCMWDHLIQDLDPDLPGFGTVAQHPELIDINGDRYPQRLTEELLNRLKALGYVSEDATPTSLEPDFMHTNSVAYHPGLDQILLSVPRFNEVWIIDHSTTVAEASGHDGGRAGRGGDLLFRWGNPVAYGRGGLTAKRLYAQHDARWIPEGMPGAGHITTFNNGLRNSLHAYSSVLEIEPPLEADGRYSLQPGKPFGPAKPVWTYTARPKHLLFAEFISGAHRMKNGNTFVTDGPRGRFLQVTPDGTVVWVYDNPFSGSAPNPDDNPPYFVFRASFLSPDHLALAGRDIQPLEPQPVPVVP